MAIYEVPTVGAPKTFSTQFPNGVVYQMRLQYNFTPTDTWLLDISDANGNPLVQGIPLVTGADLLEQYAYLGFAAKMWCTTDGKLSQVPYWYNLGSTAHLWLEG